MFDCSFRTALFVGPHAMYRGGLYRHARFTWPEKRAAFTGERSGGPMFTR